MPEGVPIKDDTMGFLNWMKKATKVIGKMAEEAAEEPLEEKSSAKCSQVPNPNHDQYKS